MPAPSLPRRTAWHSPPELDLVFSRLFHSDGEVAQQLDGLSRVKIWIARGNCPHAVESTANLLELILADSAGAGTSSGNETGPSAGELRLSYSMAMIRFVNSLVDPLQTTYYARSIASLAAQIDLPLWFVELRHQATHEELPSLGVLRDAARQALDWLYTHYWYPLLHPSPSSSSTTNPSLTLPPLPLSTLRPSLHSYKSLLKSSLRDASLAPRLKNDLVKVYKEVERWVADNALGGKGGAGREREARERAMRGVVELLVDEAGGLVPLAKKKRPTPRSPSLPPDLLHLWTPLLTRLDSTYSPPSPPSHALSSSEDSSDTPFTDRVVERAVELLCAAPAVPLEGPQESDKTPNPALGDKSYALTLVAWVVQLVVVDPTGEDEEMDGTGGKGWDDQTEQVVKQCLLAGTPNSLLLLDSLLQRRSQSPLYTNPTSPDPLATRVKPLIALLRSTDTGFERSVGAEEAKERVEEMERRGREVEGKLDSLAAAASASASSAPFHSSSYHSSFSSSSSNPASTAPTTTPTTTTPTWPAPIPNWTARPIGYVPGGTGRVEGLDLTPLPSSGVAV
ncbi:hypothetical protein JCM11251_007032 [Rhodosporidiobolus azoricus]